jgi:putative oxygen-independent coproporphyrinogen III oxidase
MTAILPATPAPVDSQEHAVSGAVQAAPERAALGAPPLVDRASFGVYVHVPFCLTRCHYCDFVTYTGMEGLRRPYAAALLEEAAMAVAALGPEPPVVTSVFVGGGTPTLLPAEDLARVLARLRELLPFAPGAEVTVEANPETVDAAMAAGLVGAGVTRVSMGAQSFDDRVLAALGRVHDAARVEAAVATMRRAGVPAVNLDLIYGGPGEDDRSWSATLDAAVALGPEHLSAYALTIEPATKFGRLVAAGRMPEPAEDDLADRYATTCTSLADAGYHHYEVSNWARPSHPSRHNLTYWRRGRYLGLGAAAHEFDGAIRRWRGGAGVPAGHQRPPATHRGGGAARRRAGAVRGVGAAASDCRRAGSGGGSGARGRPRWGGGGPAERRRAAGPGAGVGVDREGHVPARRGGRQAGLAVDYLDCYAAEHGSSWAGRGGHGPR